jgi:hypothetical protein
MFRKSLLLMIAALVALVGAACSRLGLPGGAVVPTTGNTSSDPSAAQQFVPELPGYLSTNASNISTAISTITGGASALSGNLIGTALIAQIDGMIACYQNVGAVAAKVYAQADIATIAQGQVPTVGALAVVNQDRLVNNFLPCALGSSGANTLGAQAAQPCSGSGSFVVNNETLWYLYAATHQDLCTAIVQHLPASR